jgi:putative ABC transport system permease protein
MKENYVDARRVGPLDEAARDLRYAARALRKSPLFAAVAVLTLALGIGINVTMFTVIDAVALRALPFEQPDQLVRVVTTRNGAASGDPSAITVRDVAAASRTLEGLVVYDQWRKNVLLPGTSARPEEMVVGLVPPEYFALLRVRPILGRLFTAEENRAGNNHVAAISRSLWRTRFAGSREVLGQVIRINDESYVIVAVMPDAVPAWLEARRTPTLLWTPFASPTPTTWLETSRWLGGYPAIGRMRPGVSVAEARTELSQLAGRLAAQYPADAPYGLTVIPLVDTRTGSLRPMLILLTVAVAAVLLIACANLANLLLARNAVRQRELQLRMALGASRGRLCRQLIVEAMTLAVIGGAGGLLLSFAASAAVERWHSPALPQLAELSIDGRVLAFTAVVSVITALIFGLGPAWTTSRVDLATALRSGGRSLGGTRGHRQVRAVLVIAEVALALALVTATALLTRSAANLQRQDIGFSIDHLMKAHIFIPPARYPDAAAVARFADRFGDAVRALPGVRNATVAVGYPPANAKWVWPILIDGQPPARAGATPTVYLGVTDRWYLSTLGIPLVRGRDLSSSDASDTPPVAIVNETLARRFFSAGNALGARVRLGYPTDSLPRAITIVGVFRDVKNDGLAAAPQPQIIGLHSQLPEFKVEFKDIIVRSAGDPQSVIGSIRQSLAAMDSDIPLAEEMSFASVVEQAAAERPYVTVLLGAFAALGLALAAIGIYGVVAYAVTQRTAEFGIRAALGSTPRGILWLVVRNGLVLGAIGAAAGTLLSVAAGRLIAGQLFGISAVDPSTLCATAVALVIVAALASVIPALAATRIDPIRALRGDSA